MNVFSQKKSFKIKNNLLCMQVFLSKRIVKQFSSMHSRLWLKLYTCISAWSSRLQVTCNRTYLLAQYARWINFPVHIRLDTKLHNNQYITCIYVSTCSYKTTWGSAASNNPCIMKFDLHVTYEQFYIVFLRNEKL